jgi:hypothetical protein
LPVKVRAQPLDFQHAAAGAWLIRKIEALGDHAVE